MNFDWTIRVADVVTLLGIFLAVGTFLYTKRKDRESARKDRQSAQAEHYQRLELASIQVFQNEMDHPELARAWESDRATLASGSLPIYFFDAFFYQQLNLFEMAYSFCADRTLDPEVFGSWVLWFANLCRSPYFRQFWGQTEASQNYVHGFQEVMNRGCDIYEGETYRAGDGTPALMEKHRQFFECVGKQMKFTELETWLDRI